MREGIGCIRHPVTDERVRELLAFYGAHGRKDGARAAGVSVATIQRAIAAADARGIAVPIPPEKRGRKRTLTDEQRRERQRYHAREWHRRRSALRLTLPMRQPLLFRRPSDVIALIFPRRKVA